MLRSPVTAAILLTVIECGRALARTIAAKTGVRSKDVFPYMKPWIARGLVRVEKWFTVNIYVATDYLIKIAGEAKKLVEESVKEAKGKITRRKIIEEARKRFKERHGVDMDEDHAIVLQIFLDQALNKSSPYIQVDPGREETLPKVVKTIAKERYGRELDEERVVEVLKDLELAGIIFIDRRHFKARLDRSLLGT